MIAALSRSLVADHTSIPAGSADNQLLGADARSRPRGCELSAAILASKFLSAASIAESLAASLMEDILAMDSDLLTAAVMLPLGGVAGAGSKIGSWFVLLSVVRSGSDIDSGMLFRTDERLLFVPDSALSCGPSNVMLASSGSCKPHSH